MKFTNVKQLIIKFMGGGLINFPTRFLRWVKINGDSDGSDGDGSDDGGGGSGANGNIFFQLATIQPNRYILIPPGSDTITPIDIENLDLNTYINYSINEKLINFVYSKEELTKLGFSLEELEALDTFTFDNQNPTQNNSIQIDSSIIRDNFIMQNLQPLIDGTGLTGI